MSITSAAIMGIEAVPVTVEVDISHGLPAFHLAGLPDASVRESRERIRCAIRQAGYSVPRGRVAVNLAPGDLRKEGALFDLSIALALLSAQGDLTPEATASAVFIGELALDGTIRPVRGALTVSMMAKKLGMRRVFVPLINAPEAAHVDGVEVFAVESLSLLMEHLACGPSLAPYKPGTTTVALETAGTDFADIRGQEQAKRAMEIAAAGWHNILLKGPPGTGKTLLARAIPSILPPLTKDEALEVTSIASASGVMKPGNGLCYTRPFRTPHHSSSAIALVGGGTWPKPGEVSLAHRGVLFLDELPEFSRHVLEHLRQPLEDGEVVISRAAGSMTFPARFMLVAAMNPCPCGFANDPKRPCSCTPREQQAYQKRLSGPLLDRFDLISHVPMVETDKLLAETGAEPSARVRERVQAAHSIQAKRFSGSPVHHNAEIPPSKLQTWCPLKASGKKILESAMKNQQLTARGFTRVCKVARTIADLAGRDQIEEGHLAEALQYRLV
jgi:magnesium chelatase family protein